MRKEMYICGKRGLKMEEVMVAFKFVTIGRNLGTRMLGVKARGLLLPMIESGEKVVLDFEGVDVVSNSFADECLAKLLLVMPLEELKERTTFRGLNDFAQKSIVVAFKRRLLAMKAREPEGV